MKMTIPVYAVTVLSWWFPACMISEYWGSNYLHYMKIRLQYENLLEPLNIEHQTFCMHYLPKPQFKFIQRRQREIQNYTPRSTRLFVGCLQFDQAEAGCVSWGVNDNVCDASQQSPSPRRRQWCHPHVGVATTHRIKYTEKYSVGHSLKPKTAGQTIKLFINKLCSNIVKTTR